MTDHQLLELYRSNVKGMRRIAEEGPEDQEGPHLMYCWDEYYENADYRLLLVGQEGSSLAGEATDDIEGQRNGYQDFRLSTSAGHQRWQYRRPTTPYWRALWELSDTLNPSLAGTPCFLQTNTSKYSCDGDPIPFEDHQFNVSCLNLLPEEIRVAAPHAIVFFSGPSYDRWLQVQFGGRLLFTQVVEGIPERELARIVHPNGNLPFHTYRTYHPRFLERDRMGVCRWNYIQIIASLVKGTDVSLRLSELIRDCQTLAKKQGLELLDSPPLMRQYSGFYFSKPEWKYAAIGLEFDSCGGDDFFYGIRRKNLSQAFPQSLEQSLKEKWEAEEEPTKQWPWWRWFPEPFRHPARENWELVADGSLIAAIETRLVKLLEQLEGVTL